MKFIVKSFILFAFCIVMFYSCSQTSNPVSNNNSGDTLIFSKDSISRRGSLTFDTTIDTAIKKIKVSFFLITDDGTFDSLVNAGFTIDNDPPISAITQGYLCTGFFQYTYNLSSGIYPRNIHFYVGYKPGTYFYIKMYKIKVYKTR